MTDSLCSRWRRRNTMTASSFSITLYTAKSGNPSVIEPLAQQRQAALEPLLRCIAKLSRRISQLALERGDLLRQPLGRFSLGEQIQVRPIGGIRVDHAVTPRVSGHVQWTPSTLSREVEEFTTVGLDHLAYLGVRNVGEDLDSPLSAVGPVRIGMRVVGLPEDA